MNPRYAVYRILVHSRPRFWLYTAGPFLVGYGAGATDLGQFAEPLFIYGMIYFMLFANLYLYGVNDLFDLDTDLLNPKKAGPERSAAGATRLLAASAATSALAAVPLAVDPTAAALTALYLILSTAYSTPPLRLKARPLLDSYSNWLYIVPAALGHYMSSGNLPPAWVWAAGVAWTAGMHALSAVPDIEADKKAGVKTVAVALGPRGAMLFVVANWATTAVILTSRDPLLAPSLLYPAVALYLALRPHLVPTWYWRFPYINTAMGALAFLYATRHIWTGYL